MTVHNMKTSLEVGAKHEKELDAYFRGRGWKVKEATHQQQRDGVDRWLERDNKSTSVEYKADLRASDTGNYALEIISSIPDDDGPAKFGWGVRPGAEWIVLYRPRDGVAHIFKAVDLRALVRKEMRAGASTRTIKNDSWVSQCVLVSVPTVDAIARQSISLTPAPH